MQEIHCPRCGALYFPSAYVRLCPHCSAGVPTFFSKLWIQARRFAWTLILISLIVAALRPPAWAWAFAGFLVVLALLASAWSILSQHFRRGAYAPLNLINLYPRQAPLEVNPVVPRPPPTPREWKHLLSMGRPREVYWPRAARLGISCDAAANVTFLIFLVLLGRRHGWVFVRHHTFDPSELAILIPIALWIYLLPGRILQELRARTLLRDGEVTIGCLITWVSRGQPYRVSYQFWTQTGERFERDGILMAGYDSSKGTDRIPVFYLPQDPSKSIALCCTASRIRLPEESSVHSVSNIPARP
jgi:hypothetical protein